MRRRTQRRGARMTAAAIVLAGTGLAVSGASAATGQVISSTLRYTCTAPGWQPVTAQLAVTIPATATAGQPIKPAGAGITVTLPPAGAKHLARLKASKVTVSAQPGAEAAGNGVPAADTWDVTPASAAVPSHGALVLHLPASVAPVTERDTGHVTFTMAGLALQLTPHARDRSSTSTQAPVHLSCTLDPGEQTTLATVPVMTVAGQSDTNPSTTATTWTSTPGHAFKGRGGQVTLTDTATGGVLSCTSSSLSGTSKYGRELAGTGISSITSVTFSKCSGPGGKSFTVTASASKRNPWLLNAISFDQNTATTTVAISGIGAAIRGAGCTATVSGMSATTPGTVNGVNTDPGSLGSTQPLSVSPAGGNLHAWNVSGCSGLLTSGSGLSLKAKYTINPGQDFVVDYCPPFPLNKGFPFNHFKLPPYPHHPPSLVTFPQPPQQGCANIVGFSDVKRLGEAALIGPGLSNVQISKRVVLNLKLNYVQFDSTGKLYYKPCPGSATQCRAVDGLPPVHATFLTFGFMPTSATLQITQIGTLDVASVGAAEGALKYSKIMSLASIRVEDVRVNGVPLNVGNDCHTAKPFPLVLTGKPPYELQTGGVLTGTITVPPLTGCGVGENLDPIFTSSVAGSGNYVKLTQGSLCADWTIPPLPVNCPATVPKPKH